MKKNELVLVMNRLQKVIFLSHPKTKFIQKTVTLVYLFDDKYKELLFFTFPESKM